MGVGRWVLVGIGWAACAGRQAGSTTPRCVEADAVSGTWKEAETGAYLTVGAAGGRIVAIFLQDDDGEVYPVDAPTWDAATMTLRFTSHVPSTGFTLVHTLRLDGERLVGGHTGSHVGDHDEWRRFPSAPPR